MTDRIHSKQTMPDLGPRGTTQDYFNYVFHLRIVGDWKGGGIEAVNAHLRDNPIPLYTEAYPEAVYENVVNSYNREDVAKLEDLVKELNALGKAGTLSLERWGDLESQISEILYGDATSNNRSANDRGTTTH